MIDLKNRKKLPLPVKLAVKQLYKKYGYEQAFLYIENLVSPTVHERELLIDYLMSLKK